MQDQEIRLLNYSLLRGPVSLFSLPTDVLSKQVIVTIYLAKLKIPSPELIFPVLEVFVLSALASLISYGSKINLHRRGVQQQNQFQLGQTVTGGPRRQRKQIDYYHSRSTMLRLGLRREAHSHKSNK